MAQHYQLMIPGAEAAEGRLDITSPYDEQLIAIFDIAGEPAVERALAVAGSLFTAKDGYIPLPERLEILEKTADRMSREAEQLARTAAREGGKPLVDSRIEVARAIDGVRLCVETMRGGGGTVVPMGTNGASTGKLAFTTLEPRGVVVALSAFNHPLNLIVHQVVPAVAAGCPVIVKPASKTPISCYRFVEMLRQSGLPDGWCQALVIDDSALATRLATDSRVAFLSFIGSEKIGWMLRSKLPPGARCALEHGGVAPVIIDRGGDHEAALAKILKAGFYHAGQVCVSVQRVFVHESVALDFAGKLADRVRELKVGDPLEEDTDVGPLIDPGEVLRVSSRVQEAVKEGGELVCGGGPLSPTCHECTVLFNPPDTARVSTEEIFGPVVCIYSYSDMDEAIERANALPYSFQAAVFTRDINTAMKVYRKIDATTVMVNEHTAFRVDWMPFGGEKRSGEGTGGIPYTIRDMQIEKMLVIDSPML